nr:hypothetical protein [Tanacetum cinerariifolium]
MDLFAFNHTLDPTKVKIVKRERVEDEPLKLEASIDRLFDESGSGSQAGQGGYAGVGEGTNIQPVTEATSIVIEDVAPLQPRRQWKRKTVVADAGGSSHPHKKLRDDHGIPSGPSVAGKSRLNLRTISAPHRFVISSDSSHHSGANVAKAEVDSIVRSYVPVMIVVTITTSTANHAVVVKEKTVKPSLFAADSSSAGGVDPNVGVFWILSKVTFLSVVSALSSTLILTFRNFTFLDGAEKEAEAAEAIRLRVEASNFVIAKKSLWDQVNVVNERNTIFEKERDALDVKVADLEASVVTKEREMADINTQLTSVHELEVAFIGLQEKLSNYENLTARLEEFHDAQLKVVNDKFDKLYADFVEMALHLEERFYPHLLTTIFRRRWLLTHGMELANTKCLYYLEYLSALGAAIGKAIEKDMQDGLSDGITHGAKGRVLIDVAAYNPSAEADYIYALQHLQNVNFPLLAELRSNKDASVDTVMNIIRLEETRAERLGLTESQPHVDQMMVPIHHSPDQVVVAASASSLALDVSSSRVRKIKKILPIIDQLSVISSYLWLSLCPLPL